MHGRLDIVIFAATGFTGKYVAEEFVKSHLGKCSWGIAGRNKAKLEELLSTLTRKHGKDVTDTPVIIADCSDEESLKNMARRARVVINCCGPYRFFGETVVKNCIENGAHHVDVSGEPEYMERIQLNYSEQAEQKGVYVVSACGFDSVPVDLGVIHFTNNFEGLVNSIESYMQFSTGSARYEPICNFATWESAVHGFTNLNNLIEVRKKLYSKFPRPKLEPRLAPRPKVHKSEVFDNKHSIHFPGSDRSVVARSQIMLNMLYKQRPVQYSPYLVCSDWLVLFGILIVGYLLQTLTKYSFGRKLLLKFPEVFSLGIFSRSGVSEEAAKRASVRIKFAGDGWSQDSVQDGAPVGPPNKKMITEVSCGNPAYGFTAICVLLCALTILDEHQSLPSRGGVFTPGAAFAKTNLIEKLSRNGVSFKVLEKSKI